MRSSFAVNLLSNASATGAGQSWSGGRSALTIMGTLATTTKFQLLGQDGSTWLDIATISSAGVSSYDLPAGSYRISLSGGTPSGVYATLSSVPTN